MAEEKKILTFKEKQEIIKKLPEVSVKYLLEVLGATVENDRWRIQYENGDNGVFVINEATEPAKSNFAAGNERWYEFKSGASGVGAYNLLAYQLGKNVYEKTEESKRNADEVLMAIREIFFDVNMKLKEEFEVGSFASLSSRTGEKKEYTPPPRAASREALLRGIEYLNVRRGIPREVIERNLENSEGSSIYVTYANGEERVVFTGEKNAEVRSINGTFKGATANSNTKVSGFQAEADDRLLSFNEDGYIKENTAYFAICEAAIDALSYNALYPDRLVISSNGSGKFDLHYTKTTGYLDFNAGVSIRAAFDADLAGDKAAQMLFNAIYFRKMFTSPKNNFSSLIKEHFKSYGDGWIDAMDEQWFLAKKIKFSIYESPHLLFFNDPFYKDEYEIYPNTQRMIESDDEAVDKKISYAKPTIIVELDEEVRQVLKLNSRRIEKTVSREHFEQLTKTMLVRERPLGGVKDWNQALHAQGLNYLLRYSDLHSKDFLENGKITLPEIDDSKSVLSVFRDRDMLSNPKNVEILKKYYSTKTVKQEETIVETKQLEQQAEQKFEDNETNNSRLGKTSSIFEEISKEKTFEVYERIIKDRLELFGKYSDLSEKDQNKNMVDAVVNGSKNIQTIQQQMALEKASQNKQEINKNTQVKNKASFIEKAQKPKEDGITPVVVNKQEKTAQGQSYAKTKGVSMALSSINFTGKKKSNENNVEVDDAKVSGVKETVENVQESLKKEQDTQVKTVKIKMTAPVVDNYSENKQVVEQPQNLTQEEMDSYHYSQEQIPPLGEEGLDESYLQYLAQQEEDQNFSNYEYYEGGFDNQFEQVPDKRQQLKRTP